MESKKYPWLNVFPVSEANQKKWKEENSDKSLLFWALTHKIIDRQKYFEWCREYYKIPFLKSDFFELNTFNHKQWQKAKDLKRWNRECLPICEWEGVLYVGCLEPPQDHKNWKFNYYLVLTTDLSLRMQWKIIKDFSDLLPKTKGAPSPQTTSTNFSLEEATVAPSLSLSKTPKESPSPQTTSTNFSIEPTVPSLSLETLPKENSKAASLTPKKQFKAVTKQPAPPLKTQAFPEEKENTEINSPNHESGENRDFEETRNEEAPLVLNKTKEATLTKTQVTLANAKPKEATLTKTQVTLASAKPKEATLTKTQVTLVNAKTQNTKEISLETQVEKTQVEKTQAENTQVETTQVEETKEFDTRTSYTLIRPNETFQELWEKTYTLFSGTLILKNKENQLYPVSWNGRIKIKQSSSEALVNLQENSFFKILNKNFPYHGFVVENEKNKNFFNNIGWSTLPKQVTALPLLDENKKLKMVFLGISASDSQKNIEEIKNIVHAFFKDYFQAKQETKKAA